MVWAPKTTLLALALLLAISGCSDDDTAGTDTTRQEPSRTVVTFPVFAERIDWSPADGITADEAREVFSAAQASGGRLMVPTTPVPGVNDSSTTSGRAETTGGDRAADGSFRRQPEVWLIIQGTDPDTGTTIDLVVLESRSARDLCPENWDVTAVRDTDGCSLGRSVRWVEDGYGFSATFRGVIDIGTGIEWLSEWIDSASEPTGP